MSRSVAVALLPALLAVAWPSGARASDCAPDAADKLFHPYGEPAAPCNVNTTPVVKEDEKPNIFEDDRGPRKLYNLGVSGIEGGATIAGLGGFLWVISEFLSDGGAKDKLNLAGVIVASVGGAVFLTGGVLMIADFATAPAPTPDGKGAQLMVAFRW